MPAIVPLAWFEAAEPQIDACGFRIDTSLLQQAPDHRLVACEARQRVRRLGFHGQIELLTGQPECETQAPELARMQAHLQAAHKGRLRGFRCHSLAHRRIGRHLRCNGFNHLPQHWLRRRRLQG